MIAGAAEYADRREKAVDVRGGDMAVEKGDQVDTFIAAEVVQLDSREDGEIRSFRRGLHAIDPFGCAVVGHRDPVESYVDGARHDVCGFNGFASPVVRGRRVQVKIERDALKTLPARHYVRDCFVLLIDEPPRVPLVLRNKVPAQPGSATEHAARLRCVVDPRLDRSE
jgi:hypothetical protein